MAIHIAFLHSLNPAVVPQDIGDRGDFDLPLQRDAAVADVYSRNLNQTTRAEKFVMQMHTNNRTKKITSTDSY